MFFLIFAIVFVLFVVIFLRWLRFRQVLSLFKKHSVIVYGEKGSGKDLLFSNVCSYRKLPYCSNVNYCENNNKAPIRYPFNPVYIKLGGNTYKNFMDNDIIPYDYPLPDKVDYYISDAGVYFPSHADNELDKRYPEVPMFQALLRHLGDSEFHCNIQALDRLWKKIREQAGRYILCLDCKVDKKGRVVQKIRVYDRYQSALDKVEPLKVRMPLFSTGAKTDIRLTRSTFRAKYGVIVDYTLRYKNKSKYDSRRFKRLLENGGEFPKIDKFNVCVQDIPAVDEVI